MMHKGIDGVYEFSTPPPKYIINEVKYNTTSSTRSTGVWKSKLSKTKYGLQMGDKWIERNLKNLFDEEIVLDIKRNSYKMLTGISKNGSKIEVFELTENATKIKRTKL